MKALRKSSLILFLAAILAVPLCLAVAKASAETPAAAPPVNCMDCHGQPGQQMTLSSGEKLSISIQPEAVTSSVHSGKLLCTDCHSSITSYPHPKVNASGRREYSIAQYDLCKKCHFDNYTKTLDSVHYQVLGSGNLSAPLCTDCHGAHNVQSPSEPRALISQTCSKCHESIYNQYTESVHGKALTEDNNFDVPVCTDCHRSHTIEDPRTSAFRLESVQLCSNCHGDKQLMQKYNISTDVVKTYLQDFHGASVALIGKQNKSIWVNQAVCTDCHGVHDIRAVTDPESPVIKANLVATCQSCHPDTTTNFPGAWLSHYEPSMDKTPLVFLVRRFYMIMIPFIVVGLLAHVTVDLWRIITNR